MGAVCLLLVLSLNGAYGFPTPAPLTSTGTVLNAGNQTYSVTGGTVVYAVVDGYTLDASQALTFTISAQVTGLLTSGSASLYLTGNNGSHSIVVNSSILLGDMVAAADIPVGCTTTCNSAIPLFFLGAATTTVTVDGLPAATPSTPLFDLESPYLNPWGAPIVLTSDDGSVFIVATYDTGTIQWQGTETGGAVTGTANGSPASGSLDIISHENEDLVAGTASDSGTIALTGMSPAFLNVQGTYSGTSSIPLTGTSDCSGYTGFPGTCTNTGFQSTGTATMQNSQVVVTGSYSTTWDAPALDYSSTLTLAYDNVPAPLVACTPAELRADPGQWPTVGLDGPSMINTPNATNTLSFYVTMPDAVPAAWLAGGCISEDASSFSQLNVTRVAFSVDGGPLQNAAFSFTKHGEFKCYTDNAATLMDSWRGCSGSFTVVQVWSGSLTFTVMPTGFHTVTLEAWGQKGVGPFKTSVTVGHSLDSFSGQPFAIGAQGMAGKSVVVKCTGLERMLTASGTVMIPITETYHTIVPQSGVIFGSFLTGGNVTITDENPTDSPENRSRN